MRFLLCVLGVLAVSGAAVSQDKLPPGVLAKMGDVELRVEELCERVSGRKQSQTVTAYGIAGARRGVSRAICVQRQTRLRPRARGG